MRRFPSVAAVGRVAVVSAPWLFAAPTGAAQEPGRLGDGHLRTVLEQIRSDVGLPALAALALEGDSVIEIAATGVRAVGSPERASIDDRWHLGSNTKAMTATLAGILVERGVVQWTTTIAEVFPEITDSILPEYRDVRLEELLTHTGGLSADITRTPFWLRARDDIASLRAQRRRWIVELLRLPSSPRGAYLYSNADYIVAGAMLERLTDASWETLMRREVFEPLGMRDVGFGPPGVPGVVDEPRGHVGTPGSYHSVDPVPIADNPAALGPAGTVNATLRAYGRFVAAHLAGARGDGGIVSAETFRRLQTPPQGREYAMGWIRVPREWAAGDALTHAGSNTLWYAVVWMAPERDFAAIAVTNAGGEAGAQGTDRAVSALVRRYVDSTVGR